MDEQERHPTLEPLPRLQDAPRPLILSIILLLLLIAGGTFAIVQQLPFAAHVIGRPAQLGGHGPITQLNDIVQEREQRNLLARNVILWDVAVSRVSGRFTFWVGQPPDSEVAVVIMGERTGRQPHAATDVREGDRIAIFGFLSEIRDARILDDDAFMTDEEWRRLGNETIYISALFIDILSPDPARGHRGRPGF